MNEGFLGKPDLGYLGLDENLACCQLSPQELVLAAVANGEGVISDTGALVVDTGKFTGRSPKDRFIVDDVLTHDTVFWGDVNIAFDSAKFDALLEKMVAVLNQRPYYYRQAQVCAAPEYQMEVRVISETAYQNLFSHHLFLRGEPSAELKGEYQGWTVLAVPSFLADPKLDGTRQQNFSILNFSRRIILIGGTGYTGEIKKGIFSVLNFLLPQKEVLPMHCSANMGRGGDTAIFFGLSGTGKTTLSADPLRRLIGDDEHGWSNQGVFNFEGGCYAKVAGLSAEKEPQIFSAVKTGALLENVVFYPESLAVDYSDISKTENTRVAYPVDFIADAVQPSVGRGPENIFFLTCDAFGVLPPISRLDPGQAMFHFLSGYTAKVAGTETGITEPQLTFSACFGKAFLPLNPVRYAGLLGDKLKDSNVKVWLVNTGWTGGGYGKADRIKLSYTRALIAAALSGELDAVSYERDAIFGLQMPLSCPGVPSEILNPRNAWQDKKLYDMKAAELAGAFIRNFNQYSSYASAAMLAAFPKVMNKSGNNYVSS